jgi:hypothetical protein
VAPATVLRLTAQNSAEGKFPANVSDHINGIFRGTIAVTDPMPAGLHLWLPG